MKFYKLIFLTLPFLMASCLNSDDDFFEESFDPEQQLNLERQAIEQYLADNNLTATWDSTISLYYYIEEPGTGGNPDLTDTVTVKYRGYLLNGQVFDETRDNQTATFPLAGLIQGWQLGIPLLEKGGIGTFYLPSAVAYGRFGSGSIPPNTPIIFDIELVDF